MDWKRILSRKRPAAGGEARERIFYQDCGRRLDPAQNQVAIVHFRREKVISAQFMGEIVHF